MRLLDRIAAAFVEPAGVVEPAEWEPPVPSTTAGAGVRAVALLSTGRDARLAGGAAGQALLRATGAATAVVAQWGGEPARAGVSLATPAAVRLAALLGEHGLDASSTGRLARVALSAGEADAARAARLVLDESPAPVVLMLAGARQAVLDGVLLRFDRALVAARATEDLELARFAASDLIDAGVAAAVVDLSAPLLATALARAGLGLREPLRRRFAEAL